MATSSSPHTSPLLPLAELFPLIRPPLSVFVPPLSASIIAQYVKSETRNAQFIIISLRNNMFELADRLIGIYKTHNCTRSVAINPADFVVPAPATTAGNAASCAPPPPRLAAGTAIAGFSAPAAVKEAEREPDNTSSAPLELDTR